MNIDPDTNPLSLSDEDFRNATPPVVEAGEVAAVVETPDPNAEVPGKTQAEIDADKVDDPDEVTNQPDPDADKGGEDGKDKSEVLDDKSGKDNNLPQDKSKEAPKLGADGKPIVEEDKSKDAAATPPNYEEFYQKVMAPLHANGKKIELRTPEEAIQLMQQGANYTRKMQAIAPHRKILLMLEKANLLDEGKLSLLIDVDKKDPEAIKKLLKDSGIDPLDIDTKTDSTYQEGNHRVSDEEVGFKTTLEELTSSPEGRETLNIIHTQWDQASKEILWKQPEVMTLIDQQRKNGVYAIISTEIERQRALGAIPPSVSYLTAYKNIGDALAANGAFDHLNKPADEKPAASPVVIRAAVPKPDAKNGDKVNAAATPRNAGKKAETIVNPLALSDEEFQKQFAVMQGRI